MLTALATFLLLGVGGLVTSHGVGMAVPDWPNTYGYNMFRFPFSQWLGGIFYEHSHRLVASGVGLLTAILAGWLWVRETRGRLYLKEIFRHAGRCGMLLGRNLAAAREQGQALMRALKLSVNERWLGLGAILFVLVLMGVRKLPVYVALAAVAPVFMVLGFYRFKRDTRQLRWLGIVALAAVILQGVLGGLRVVWLADEIGIFHATLAQLFFVLICAITLMTSRWWNKLPSPLTPLPSDRRGEQQTFGWGRLRGLVLATTLLIFFQLLFGATMRHQHAGLAIPDFPLAYGKVWPAMDTDSVARYNQQRVEVTVANPITAFQIGLQMAHRLMAVLILFGVGLVAWRVRSSGFSRSGPPEGGVPNRPVLRWLAFVWLGLILIQVGLGAWTIWSNKAADVATVHVLVGALSLVTGALWCVISFARPVDQFGFQSVPLRPIESGRTSFEARAAAMTNI